MPTRIASSRFIRGCDSLALLRVKTSLLIIAGHLANTTDCRGLRQNLSSDAYRYWSRRAGSRRHWLPNRRPRRYRSSLRSALEDAISIGGCTPKLIERAGSVGHQAPDFGEDTERIDGRNTI